MMPANRPRRFPLLLLTALLGCDTTIALAPRTPHGGSILPLPEGLGSIELVREGVAGPSEQARFVAYFFGPDDRLMASPPTAATFKPTGPEAQLVEFKPGGPGGSPLASAPFPAEGEIEGEFAATIAGKPIRMPIRVR